MKQKTIEYHEWNSLMNIFLSGALMRACRFQRATEESEIFWGEHDANYLRGLRGTPRIASSIMKPSRRERSARVDDDRDEASLNFRASINDYPAGMVILSNVLNIILRSQGLYGHPFATNTSSSIMGLFINEPRWWMNSLQYFFRRCSINNFNHLCFIDAIKAILLMYKLLLLQFPTIKYWKHKKPGVYINLQIFVTLFLSKKFPNLFALKVLKLLVECIAMPQSVHYVEFSRRVAD